MSPYRTQPRIAPDDLPDGQLAEALTLQNFLRRHRLTFVPGAESTRVALNLERAGLLKLRRAVVDGVEILEVAE